jgi:hypothetical protein
MAFTRFSSSDLYVFPSTDDDGNGQMECCACALIAPDTLTGGSFYASTPKAFYDHLKQHEAAGHHVEGGYRALIEAIDAEAHLWFGVGH